MNLSFAGCGFLGIYHVGVAVCFKRYAPHLLLDKISGASAGAIAACCLLCDLPLGEMTSNLLRLAREARQRTLGPFSPSFNVQEVLLESLQRVLPEDAHLRVSGKLHISLTRVYDGKNVIVSRYESRRDLLQALLASSFVPLFCGLLPPRFHGIRYMDGGFSDNLPTLDENTITVSPFCGESDICPRDLSAQLFHVNLANTSIELSRQNVYRFARILFPPNPEVLAGMCKQGFDDALRFLDRNGLISCERCLAVQSTFALVRADTLEEGCSGLGAPAAEFDPECLECKLHRQEASVASLPETVLSIFQDAIDSANRGLVNWLFKHRSVKLLSLLSLPYTLPADLVYATFTKFIFNVPKLQRGLVQMSRYFLEQLSLSFPKINVYYQPVPRTINCRLDIMDYQSGIYGDKFIDQPTYELREIGEKRWAIDESPANCVIDVSDLSATSSSSSAGSTAGEAFDILQVASANQDALMAYYYINDDGKANFSRMLDKRQEETNETHPHYQDEAFEFEMR